MDYGLWIHFLSLITFAAVAHCAQWVSTNIMASQPNKSKEKALWSHVEGVAFLNYLIKHLSEAVQGGFKSYTMSGAIAAIAPLHERGATKKVSTGTNKWDTASTVEME